MNTGTIVENLWLGLQIIALLMGGGLATVLLFCLCCAGGGFFAQPKWRTRPQLDIRQRESMLRESLSIFTLKLKREPQSVPRRTVS